MSALDVDWIERELRARKLTLGHPITHALVTASTNDDAKRAARDGAPHGVCFVAEEQTQGRGRHGRSWSAPQSEALLLSLVLRPPTLLDPSPLTLAVGLGVQQGAQRHAPVPLRVKWPNDVVVGRRKLAGILLEVESLRTPPYAVIAGIGLNVMTEIFPEDVAHTAVSLRQLGSSVSREELCRDVLIGIEAWYNEFVQHGMASLVNALRPLDALLGERIAVEGQTGEARGIDEQGRLLLATADGTVHALGSGTVEWLESV